MKPGTERPFQACRHCILDTNDDPNITFDEDGVCNYCHEFENLKGTYAQNNPSLREEKLNAVVEEIKKAGKGKEYDCIVGVSGGVDSAFLCYKAVKLGLRPLVVHYDNGWNSEMAVSNIENIVKKLGLDLYTYVNDWEEFRDIQISFLKASVLDVELITDQAIVAILFKLAKKHGIRHILIGNNFETEAILPSNWYHWKLDVLNITAIHKQFGKVPLKTYPVLGFWKRWYTDKFSALKTVPLLNYFNYNKQEAKETITSQLGWRDYGGKHYESIFTRFYQAYYLPRKFGIDKRKAHLSTLICAGQISRDEALKELAREIYPEDKLKEDKDFVLKKLGFTEAEFETIMQTPPRAHTDFPSYLTRHYKYQQKFSDFFRLFWPGTKVKKHNPLRVLHVVSWYPDAKHTHRALFVKEHILALNQYCKNHVMHVEVLFDENSVSEHRVLSEFEESHIIHMLNKRWLFSELRAFSMLFKELIIKRKSKDFDIINLYIAYPFGIFLNTLRFFTGKPIIITEQWSAYHFNFHTEFQKRGLRRIKRIFSKDVHVITVSEALSNDISTFSGIANLDHSVVPNVVDIRVFNNTNPAPPAPPHFFMLSVWSVIKKPFPVIDAFAEFLKEQAGARLTIGGYGPEWENLKNYVTKLGLNNSVTLAGTMEKDEIAAQLNRSTALFHSSSYETFSVICAEAICCGTPVVASRVGGIPDFINESNGILIDNQAPEEWLKAMRKVSEHGRYDRVRISREASDKFSRKHVGRKFAAILENQVNQYWS